MNWIIQNMAHDDESSDEEPSPRTLQGVEEEVVRMFSEGVKESVSELSEVLESRAEIELDSSFIEYRETVKNHMADEWESDPVWWNKQTIDDWYTIQERVSKQIEESQERQMGVRDNSYADSGYFGIDRLGSLRYIEFEQFVLESNAGQFREERFYCDKGRRWLNKVKETFRVHGYSYVRKIEIEGLVVLEVSKNPMGEL